MAGPTPTISGPQLGCMDPLATNYCAACTVDDGSCDYTTGPSGPVTGGITISFSEEAKGWTSFKSFVQDSGLSLNNIYYTFKRAPSPTLMSNPFGKNFMLWEHHSNQIRNNFYNKQSNSHVDVLFNEESATVKSFASMKYEGTQAKITQNLGSIAGGVNYPDNEYYNNENTSTIPGFPGKPGWYVESGNTDLQLAGEMEFKDKEGKWFSYMKGVPVKTVDDLNSKEFSFQGIDIFTINQSGCMDPEYTNYDPNANLDCLGNPVVSGYGDTSCCCEEYGCMDDTPGIYPLLMDANGDGMQIGGDLPCSFPCTSDNTPTGIPLGFAALNYDPKFDCDDGSCFYPRWWCDDGNCEPDTNPSTSPSRPYQDYEECIANGCETPGVVPGCMDSGNMGQTWWDNNYISSTGISIYPGIQNINYNSLATIDDGSCCYTLGCTDPLACNYAIEACTDDGSCVYADGCNDPTALNYNASYGGCICNDPTNFSCCTYPAACYDLTINDSTPIIDQLNYSVSTFTKTCIPGGSMLPFGGLGGTMGNQTTLTYSEYKLEITSDAGYTVQASDFAIEHPNGVASQDIPATPSGNSTFFYGDDWVFGNSGLSGQGYDLGMGPLVSVAVFKDSENPTNTPNWIPTDSNIVEVYCFLQTDMKDNIPGVNWPAPGIGLTGVDVFMTHNGMNTTNTFDPGIPDNLDIFINIIGASRIVGVISGCTDPNAINYNYQATVDDGSCVHCDGVNNEPLGNYFTINTTAPTASNINPPDGTISVTMDATAPGLPYYFGLQDTASGALYPTNPMAQGWAAYTGSPMPFPHTVATGGDTIIWDTLPPGDYTLFVKSASVYGGNLAFGCENTFTPIKVHDFSPTP